MSVIEETIERVIPFEDVDISDFIHENVTHVWYNRPENRLADGSCIAVCGEKFKHECPVGVYLYATESHCRCGTPICDYCRLLIK